LTYQQIQLFIEAAIEIEKQERQVNLLESAIAAQGNKEAITKRLKELGG
jgi:hypothetical protein